MIKLYETTINKVRERNNSKVYIIKLKEKKEEIITKANCNLHQRRNNYNTVDSEKMRIKKCY